MELEQHLREMELKLLQPEIRASAEALSALIACDFREFGSSGRIFHKADVIAALATDAAATYHLSKFRAEILCAHSVLLTYEAIRSDSLTNSTIATLRSSIWVLRDDRWQLLFHQGTRIPTAEVE